MAAARRRSYTQRGKSLATSHWLLARAARVNQHEQPTTHARTRARTGSHVVHSNQNQAFLKFQSRLRDGAIIHTKRLCAFRFASRHLHVGRTDGGRTADRSGQQCHRRRRRCGCDLDSIERASAIRNTIDQREPGPVAIWCRSRCSRDA